MRSVQTAPLVPEVAGIVVPAAGYRWVEVEREVALPALGPGKPLRRHRFEEPHLQPVVRRWPQPSRTTFPLRDAQALCKTLAALDPADPDGLLAFANEHGALGVGDLMRGEPLSSWGEAIGDVAMALALLDAQAPVTLAGWISWRPGVAQLDIERQGRRRRDRLALTDAASRQLEAGYHLRQGDSRTAARLFAQRIINAGLEAHAAPRLLWNPRRKALELRIAPGNLLGVIWLQVAQAAAGEVEHVECPGCGTWFPVGIGYGRADKRTCGSATCRKRIERAKAKAATPKRVKRRAS